MPFLVILKRFEVWLLLGLVAGLVYFALQPPPPLPGTSAPGTGSPVEAAAAPALVATSAKEPPSDAAVPDTTPSLTVREVRVIPSSPGYIVETVISGGAARDSDLVLGEDHVRATTPEGQPVNRFFEPFHEVPVLSASGDSPAALRWWLPASAPSLWIEIEGERIEAKLP